MLHAKQPDREGAHRVFPHEVHFGLAELINRMVVVLRLDVSGDRDPASFRLKTFRLCSLPHHSGAGIVL